MTNPARRKKILVVCPHPFDFVPAQRLKFEQYYNSWRANGYDVDVAPFMSERMQRHVYQKGHLWQKIAGTLAGYGRRLGQLGRLKSYDIVYVFLWVTPLGPPLMEWLYRKLARKIVYDIDDLVYLGHTSPHNRIIRYLKSAQKVNFLMKTADQVLVSTDKLLNYAQKFTRNISTIPATVDISRYNSTASGTNKKVVIGWSGSHSTSKYLHLLDEVLRKIAAKYPVVIRIMGDDQFKIAGLPVERVQWTAATEAHNLQQFDIGLHPLPDEEWVYGKSGGKMVQYMAAGIPIVASAIGPNHKAIQNGYNGFLVATDEQWIEKLSLLIEDESMRQRMGKNARTVAEQRYSVEANAYKYLDLFKRLEA